MGFIYKVTNKINGKIYIGQTTQTIEKRWKQHVYEANKPIEPYKSALHRAIKKYGEDSFELTKVEECDDAHLDDREIYWIDYYNSYHDGYNLDLGGRGSCRCDDNKLLELWNSGYSLHEISQILPFHECTLSAHLSAMGVSKEEKYKRGAQQANKTRAKPIYQYDIDGNYIAEYASKKEVQKQFNGLKISTNAKYKLYGGYQWRRFKVDKIDSVREYQSQEKTPKKENPKKNKCKNVYQYTLDGQYIRSFDSAKNAADYFSGNPKSIRNACNGKTRQAFGYQWSYDKFDHLNSLIQKKEPKLGKAVYQYDIDGNYIQSFNSISEAANYVHGAESSIRDVCNGKLMQTHNYQWRFEKYDKLQPLNINKIKPNKPVHQYTISGKYIQSFESSEAAAKVVNCNARAIRKVCSGKLNQTGGYQWRHEKYDNIESIESTARSSKKKEVYQYSLDGLYIQSFSSVKEASALFNDTKLTKIPRACREEVSQAYGFSWRYYKVKHL